MRLARVKDILLRHAGIPLYAPIHRRKLSQWERRTFPLIDEMAREARRRNPGPLILIGLHHHIGDVLMATAVIRALRSRHPDATLFFATQARFRTLLEHNPRLDYVVDCSCMGSLMMLARHPALDGAHLLTLHGDCCELCGAVYSDPHRVFSEQGIDTRRWFFHGRHLVNLMFERLALEGACPRPEIFVPEPIKIGMRARLREILPAQVSAIVAMHTRTPHWLTKQWPTARFVELMKRVMKELGAAVLVLGSEPVSDLPPGAINLTGQTSLLETAALLGEIDLFVGLDSGPSHLASAVGTPSVVLFGPTDPATCRPLGPGVTTLWHGCDEDGLFAKSLRPGAPANRDIAKITVDEVMNAIVQAIRAGSPSRAAEAL